MAAVTSEKQSEGLQTPTQPDHVTRLLAQVTADAGELQSLMIGFVRKDGNAAVRWTPMAPAMLSHLSRIFDLKIDREYTAGMFPQSPIVRPPSVNQAVAAAIEKAAAQPKTRSERRVAKKLAKRSGADT